jgi:hypothetical protein
VGDVETLRAVLLVELRRPGCNKKRVCLGNEADLVIAQMGSHSAFRHGPGMESWPLVACLNVFRAIAKALLNFDRETFTDNAIFDATVDSVAATR